MPLIPALRWRGTVAGVAGGIVLAALVLPGAAPAVGATPVAGAATATPIKHVVVLYQENHSFDNYFGTYPNAANPPGEPALHAAAGTPSVNGLSEEILTHNPNLVNPF